MDRVNGLNWVDIGDGRRGFRGRNASIGLAGTEVTEKFLNDVQEELAGVVERYADLDADDQRQLLRAIRSGRLTFAEAGGTAAAIVVTLDPALSAHVIGMRLTVAMASAAPAGATLNAGPGVLPVKLRGGADLPAGAWAAGDLVTLTCTGTAWQVDGVNAGGWATLAEVIAAAVANKWVAPATLAKGVQRCAWTYAVAGGTATALTVALTPAPTSYDDISVLWVKAPATNTGAATLTLAGLGAREIVRTDGSALRRADIVTGQVVMLVNDGAKFQLHGGVSTSLVPTSQVAVFDVNGTFTVPSGLRSLKRVRVWGAGGGGGRSGGTGAIGAGGAAGAYAEMFNVAVEPGDIIPVTVGAGGAGGVSGSINGGSGGASSFGSIVTCGGGAGGGGASSGVAIPGSATTAPTVTGGFSLPGGRGFQGSLSPLLSGNGGAAPFGGGQTPPTSTSAGPPGNTPGGGGGGAGANTGGLDGGAGAGGLVIVEY